MTATTKDHPVRGVDEGGGGPWPGHIAKVIHPKARPSSARTAVMAMATVKPRMRVRAASARERESASNQGDSERGDGPEFRP